MSSVSTGVEYPTNGEVNLRVFNKCFFKYRMQSSVYFVFCQGRVGFVVGIAINPQRSLLHTTAIFKRSTITVVVF